ncbi:phosphatidate cytidylyltransferase [Spizellomyces sp. 'palustris']|nr:phosphatidate cytidylyltransferase [Spizellomyces sp. 'palustris']
MNVFCRKSTVAGVKRDFLQGLSQRTTARGRCSCLIIASRRYHANHVLRETSKASNPELDEKLHAVLADFNAPVRYAVAYGSGVFRQKGYKQTSVGTKDAPMVDFIFGVTHPEHWHSLNIRQNRHHYSALAYLGSNVVSKVQERVGAGVYFNPDVHVGGMRIKYGVVSMDRLIRDLMEWETLYLAGRLQKPVKILRDDARVSLANRKNLRTAVRTALLLLPQHFTEEELFTTIAGLSYKGDFRMRFGENPHKIYNIVYTQMDAFREIYKPIVEDLPNANYLPDGAIEQDYNVRLRASLVQKLPKHMNALVQNYHRWYISRTEKIRQLDIQEPELSVSVVSSPELPRYIEKSLADIVRRPAITQSVKGVFTAGLGRAYVYAKNKLAKFIAGRSRAP